MKKILYWIIALSITGTAVWQTWPTSDHIFGANQKISELSSYVAPATGDILPINDTANATTKQITVDNLFNVSSSFFRVKDSSDTTKKVALDVSGVTTATTRTLIVPNTAGTIALGTGTANQLAYWSGTNTLAGNSAFVIDTSLGKFTTTNLAFTSATGTNATTTTLNTTTATTTNLFGAGLSTCTGTSFLHWSGGSFTCGIVSSGSTVVTTIPHPNWFTPAAMQGVTLSSNTTLFVGQVIIPATITANKINFLANAVTTTGTLKVALFSEDGQTQYFSITTASISAQSVVQTALSAVALSPGIYYIAILPASTANIQVINWSSAPVNGQDLNTLSTEPTLSGNLTVTASTMPATITPTSISAVNNATLLFRLDN